MPVLPGAEPFARGGSGELADTGVLLVHGFTGSPQSMRPWGDALTAAGLAVSCPRLPGHGTRWQEMNSTRWPDWYGTVERAYESLVARCDQVFVAGLSMGGALALRAAERQSTVAGLLLVNPSLGSADPRLRAVPLLSKVLPSFPGIGSDIKKPGVSEGAYSRVPLKALASLRELWAVVGADLGAITCPILTFRSTEDHVVDAVSGRVLAAGASSTEVVERELADSYHVATLDNDAPMIFAESVAFVRTHRAAPALG